MPGRVIYLVRSWPRLSQTFMVNEVLALERLGSWLDLYSLVALRRAAGAAAGARTCAPPCTTSTTRRGAPRCATTRWSPVRRRAPTPGRCCSPRSESAGWRAGYATLSTAGLPRHAAVRLAAVDIVRARAADGRRHVHAHFAHDPALVGMLVARLTGPAVQLHRARPRPLPDPRRGPARPGAGGDRGGDLLRVNVRLPRVGRPARGPSRRSCVIHHGVDLHRFVPGGRGAPRHLPADRVGRAAGREEGIRRPAPRAARGEAPRRALPAPDLRRRAVARRARPAARRPRTRGRGGAARGRGQRRRRRGACAQATVFALTPRELPPTATGTGSRTCSSRRWRAACPSSPRPPAASPSSSGTT